jgi:hypothetical protein
VHSRSREVLDNWVKLPLVALPHRPLSTWSVDASIVATEGNAALQEGNGRLNLVPTRLSITAIQEHAAEMHQVEARLSAETGTTVDPPYERLVILWRILSAQTAGQASLA